MAKTVLMTQSVQRQGEIWHSILTSQGFTVIWEGNDADLVHVLGQMQAAGLTLPDLILIDMGMAITNPYRFCQLAQQDFPGLTIVITVGEERAITSAERRWAIRQGAADLLPGIQQSTLVASVVSHLTRIMELLNALPLQQDALMAALSHLTVNRQEAPADVPTPIPPPPSLPQPTHGKYRGTDVSTEQPTALPKPEDDGQPRRRYRGSSY
ncbi:response regulator [Candidatus Synechococcus calcipolaris G9]|uniref:Response regulator n=1 Tax=Candidatus Synechococcus calcipolaris G9 TaxID=1497997 RepID=A0ABT6EW41_9SYNE|nr:response regulator [Candidatus Synechococcus calcipolaris]MDG2990002.1 response regulator [Candidatus Synechococcus calcipolaris G9]